jgi:prophage antirepressor-like protein
MCIYCIMSNNFYLDIYNKILEFNKNTIFIIFDNEGQIWFKFKDLLNILEYNDTKDAIKNLKIDKNYLANLNNIKVGGLLPPHLQYATNDKNDK